MNSKKIITCSHYKGQKKIYKWRKISQISFGLRNLEWKTDEGVCIGVTLLYPSIPCQKVQERLRDQSGKVSLQGHEGEASTSWINAHETDSLHGSLFATRLQWKQRPARSTYPKNRMTRPPWTQCWGVWSRNCRTLGLPLCPRATVLPARNQSLERWDAPRWWPYSSHLCLRVCLPLSQQGLLFLLIF